MIKYQHARRAPLWRQTALAAALSMSFAGIALAQSNASGAIFGSASAGDTVVVENQDTGLSRSIPVDSAGRYRASSLPVGKYRVSLQHDGKTVSTRENIPVTIAGASDVSFVGAEQQAKNLEGVSVVASALPSIDVSSVDTRTVFTAEQLAKIPVARNAIAAALLAPGVLRGDSRFGNNVLAIGGSGISENSYSINGYNITNPQTSETFFEMPFVAIDQQQVLLGGQGAEFGHSTGGTINIVGKRGTNTWKGGIRFDWTPAGLREDQKNLYYADHPDAKSLGDKGFNTTGQGITTPFASDGKMRQYLKNTNNTQSNTEVYLGGPLIKDRLFFFGAASYTNTKQHGATQTMAYLANGNLSVPFNANGGWQTNHTRAEKWYGKLDWNITDNHILELMGMADNSSIDTQNFAWSNVDFTHGKHNAAADGRTKNNNQLYTGKYTGYITDDLTVTALYGEVHSELPNLSSITPYQFVSASAGSPVAGLLHNYQTVQRPAYDGSNKSKGWRLDVEYRLGAHDLRAGIDRQTLRTVTGQESANLSKDGPLGGEWNYNPDPRFPLGTATLTRIRNGGNYRMTLNAYYLQDSWQVSDRWLAYIGLRNEGFENFNSFGQSFMKQNNQWAPRLGVSWDVNGDSSFKIYANAGRYYLALPNGVAVRGAGGSLFTTQDFTFSGVDPATDLPINPVALGPSASANAEFGTPRDPKTARINNLKAHYQDEFILGFDKQLNESFTYGAKMTYRELKSQVDDTADPRPVCKYMAAHYTDFSSYADCISNFNYQGVIFNPGRGADFYVDVADYGNAANPALVKPELRHVVLTAQDLGMVKPKRKFAALETYIEHPFDGKWMGKLSYTWSHSFGNTEGQVKSDIAQLDVAASQDWDFPEFMRYGNGNLPNDRRHQLKAFGYYQITPEWMVGSTIIAASGRPKNCLGAWFPDANGVYTDPSNAYMTRPTAGGAYHVCYGKISSRGDMGNLPWTYTMDLSVNYSPEFAKHNLNFSFGIFNLFNQQRTITMEERAMGGPVDDGSHNSAGAVKGGTPMNIYQRTIAYSAPRYMRLSVQYDFSL